MYKIVNKKEKLVKNLSLVAFRKKVLGKSQIELAELLGIGRSTYVNYEIGYASIPDHVLNDLVKLGYVPGAPADSFESVSTLIPKSQLSLLIDTLHSVDTNQSLRDRARNELRKALGISD